MKAAVIGLGVEGKKAVNSLLSHGWAVYATDLNSNVDLSDLELPMISMNLVSGGETVSIVSDNLTVDLGFSNSSAIEECDAIAISPSMYGGAFADKLLEKGKLLSNVVTKHKDIFTIGITGTNGKTTSVHMLKSILENAGKKVLVGGNGGGGFSGYYDLILEASNDDYDILLVEVCDMTLDFCNYCFDFDNMKSIDSRHENAKGDIIRHTINNDDYPYCWVFEDDRFGLANGSDEMFLRFICEIFHPLVRDEKKQWGLFLEKVNNLIKEDGYELYIKEYISGREVYDYRFYGVDVADKMDKNAIRDLIDEFKSGLIAKATNGDMSEKDYKRCRDILMQVPELKSHIPAFIKSNHSANDFRRYMQAYNQHYADRL